ncbi:MAG: shikimate dehydrogenase [Lachnospiraceae bacterium]|nr:shikimate dehydrogenase [Lachnospiraceae bacterium]
MPEKYGIIGYPLMHSLSPFMHNRYAYYMGQKESYEAFEILPERLSEDIKKLHDESVLGLNVTIPYKQKILNCICDIDECAKKIGAVNTLKYTDAGYVGYNTDAEGLKLSLMEAGISLKDKDVLILGAGGAARAAAYVSSVSGCSSISVLNRTLEKAILLAEDFEADAFDYSSLNKISKPEYIVFQTTSVGMYPDVNAMLPVPESLYSRFSAGIEVIYNPKETAFINSVSKTGAKIINGFSMLVNQALASRLIWHPEQTIPGEIRRKVYNECSDYSWS